MHQPHPPPTPPAQLHGCAKGKAGNILTDRAGGFTPNTPYFIIILYYL